MDKFAPGSQNMIGSNSGKFVKTSTNFHSAKGAAASTCKSTFLVTKSSANRQQRFNVAPGSAQAFASTQNGGFSGLNTANTQP